MQNSDPFGESFTTRPAGPCHQRMTDLWLVPNAGSLPRHPRRSLPLLLCAPLHGCRNLLPRHPEHLLPSCFTDCGGCGILSLISLPPSCCCSAFFPTINIGALLEQSWLCPDPGQPLSPTTQPLPHKPSTSDRGGRWLDERGRSAC